MLILQLVVMRTYGKNFIYKKTVNYKQRQERLATEWDVRIDVTDDLPADKIVERVREARDELLYALVSGVERPDKEECNIAPNRTSSFSQGNHVHVCIVLLAPLKRADVLRMVRGPRKLGDEYAAPRNPKFTYAGWIIHHGKPAFKLDGEPLVRYESGTLPLDALTTDNALKITSILKKWGTDGTKNRFKVYSDLLERENIKQKIEQLQMQLEDK